MNAPTHPLDGIRPAALSDEELQHAVQMGRIDPGALYRIERARRAAIAAPHDDSLMQEARRLFDELTAEKTRTGTADAKARANAQAAAKLASAKRQEQHDG